jgi:hypothetical protein
MKTKMKFSDIAGMLERDEMKEIVGGFNSILSGITSPRGDSEKGTEGFLYVMEDGGPIKIPIYMFGGVPIIMPKDTKSYIELKEVEVYKNSDPRSPNYDPYGQWTGNTYADVFQNMGDSISGFGIGLSATGFGAVAGGTIMFCGSVVSGIGTVIELGVDIHGNTWESFDGEKWVIKGTLEATNFGAGRLGMPIEAEAYYNAWSIGAGRGIDYMTEFREPN